MTYDEAVEQLEDLATVIGRSSDAVAIRVVLAEARRLRALPGDGAGRPDERGAGRGEPS